LEILLLLLAIEFLGLRWYTIVAQIDTGREHGVFDKWYFGPPIMNFFAVAWFVSKALPLLQEWETPLHSFKLVGQNMIVSAD
jgi:hypothetical protein